jgi:hypothetical protein
MDEATVVFPVPRLIMHNRDESITELRDNGETLLIIAIIKFRTYREDPG